MNENVRLSKAGLDLIKVSEGLELKAYLCPAKKLTVGYGHLVLSEDNIKLGDLISEERAEQFLIQDLKKAESAVKRLVKVPLNEDQYSALVDFVYNLGSGSLQISTLLKLLNKGKYNEAAEQFGRWVFANGKKLNGLVIRREKERKLFLGIK